SKFKLVRIILHEISQYTIHSCISKERYAKWINLQINGEELGAISAEEIERHGEFGILVNEHVLPLQSAVVYREVKAMEQRLEPVMFAVPGNLPLRKEIRHTVIGDNVEAVLPFFLLKDEQIGYFAHIEVLRKCHRRIATRSKEIAVEVQYGVNSRPMKVLLSFFEFFHL